MTRKSNALTALLAALVLLATVTSGVALGDATVGGEDDESDSEQSVYLVFGADVASDDLDQWVEKFKNGYDAQSAESTVVQYQDVDQLNVNQQGDAVAISIGDSTARAIQQTEQTNTNEQIAVAQAQNRRIDAAGTSLRNVQQVNVIFADGGENASGYTGMVVEDDSGDDARSQFADAEVVQSQDVGQLNYNNQSSAIAIADENSTATAYQESYQENVNQQFARANASNVAIGASGQDQTAEATVDQAQEVNQTNVNLQGIAVAIAADDSTALAVQQSYQRNANSQIGVAGASNTQIGASLLSPESTMATASAGSSDAENADGNDSESTTQYADDRTKLTTQESVAKVKQHQEVAQQNVNNQNLAFAFAIDDSTASAYQSSEQRNENAQLASATSTNIRSQMTSLVMSGSEMSERPGWAIEFDGAAGTSDQRAWSRVEQTQLIDQLNFNQQSASVAIAMEGGDSSTFQVNFQQNENVQEAVVEAINECEGACGASDGSDGDDKKSDDEKDDDQKSSGEKNSDEKDGDDSNEEKNSGTSDGDSEANDDNSGDDSSETGSDDGSDGDSSPDEDESTDSLPGFGVGVAALSLLGVALIALRRE